ENSSLTTNFTAGLVYRFFAGWSAALEANVGEQRSDARYFATTLNRAAITAAVNAGTLNPFQDVNEFRWNLDPYDTSTQNRYGPATTTDTEYSLRFGGPVFRAPGGDAFFTGLVDQREEVAEETRLGPTASPTVVPERSQLVRSLYGELRVP